jgi:acyl-CoA dehydrogenase
MTGSWSTPERQALRETARRFTEREIVPHLPTWEDEGALPRELHAATAKAGLLGVGFPEAVGGQGGDAVDTLVVAEEMILAGATSGLVAGLFTHGIGLPHLVEAGGADLVDRVARPVLAGEAICSLAITEPDAGSDVAGLATRAVRDGDHYVVTGAKTYITSGTRADFITTAVRTGEAGYGGISLLVLERGMPGLTVSPPLRKMGWLCSDTAELRFDEVRVPVGNRIGEEGSGFLHIMRQFAAERLSLAVQAYATAARCLDLTIGWVHQRETFGRPLSSRQVVRHKVAEMARQVDVARTYTRAVTDPWRRTPLSPRATTSSTRPSSSTAAWATCGSARWSGTTATRASSASAAGRTRSWTRSSRSSSWAEPAEPAQSRGGRATSW